MVVRLKCEKNPLKYCRAEDMASTAIGECDLEKVPKQADNGPDPPRYRSCRQFRFRRRRMLQDVLELGLQLAL